MKRVILGVESEWYTLKQMYKNCKMFNDKDIQSAEIRDLTDKLDETNVQYEIYNDKTDNGCTVFYD